MITKISRRFGLKLLGLGALFGFVPRRETEAQDSTPTAAKDALSPLENWRRTHDRVWLGGMVWANPMEDWRVADGWAVCQTPGANRNIHSLTHQITNPKGGFTLSVRLGRPAEALKQDGGAGFRVGIRAEIDDHRAHVFANGGINAGIAGAELLLGPKRRPIPGGAEAKEISLTLVGKPEGGQCALTLTAADANTGTVLGSVTHRAPAENVLGNVAVVSQFTGPKPRKEAEAYRFRDWQAGGDAFTVTEANRFGPLLWSMYSLSDSRGDEGFVMKISALTGPLGEKDNQTVELQVQRGGEWESLGEATLDPDAWVATFRIPKWNQKEVAPYKLVYREKHTDGAETADEWTGTIKANPEGRPLRLGALTCQNDYAFPYTPVAENLVRLDPDMLYFSGDQLYENHGGYGIIRDPAEPAILNYLRKFYQHGWAFREAMRDRPTLCLPDDHDVFQGNIWGEGGAPMQGLDQGASSKGGYREPARMVNVVHRTNAAHHPDYYDPTPCLQDISVYYGDMVYGGVSFAVIGDRQWKSGPERVDTGSGRADHVPDKDFDTSVLDKPGLVLLGERQEAFLEKWGDDWRGHTMKVLLSQTVLAGVATHHGGYDGYLKADLDSGGWPQTPRNRAIDIVRKSMALHINGDQHLTTLCQYGVGKQRDSNWSFCTPAIAAGYPRWWRPDELGMPHENRPKHGLGDTGEFLDGLGNKVYVYAVGNPEVGTEKNRYDKAHQKGSGFGLVTIDTEKKTYLIESFRFKIDATDGNPANQFPGWPVTLHQAENRGENAIG
ncbi:MAG: alkaline phosphatase D family protein [Akkermansiaceae bacterium]|nr:alkaline phosphatase D family protein [Akkermansiaceae bacterium]MCP5550177.1 alkaline phosphatase D family protein [Akkermansiaceae bacterium]